MDANLKKQVFNKKAFDKTIDNKFSQLVSTPNPLFFDINLATVEDFFTLYNKLFYEIPKTGETNSHEYLIKTSSAYTGYEYIDDQIKALIEEIDSLREEVLSLQEENIDLLSKNNDSPIISKPVKVKLKK